MPTPLNRLLLSRNALAAARSLLGSTLIHETAEGTASGRIVEVEAYRGPEDRAAHSFGGRRTARNEVMYGPPGHAYVYFIYGMHFCINVVTARLEVPEAVLIRALEPLEGIELMRRRRGLIESAAVHLLARGPGNLCRALGVDRSHNGFDLLSGPLRLEAGRRVASTRIVRAARVGVGYAGAHALRPWRLYERGNAAVSKPA